jgi:hypothetical protein
VGCTIVGSVEGSDERSTTMAESSLSLEQVLGKLLADEHADLHH